ncbi:MAG: helicase-related protein, partial [Enterococcus sp.]
LTSVSSLDLERSTKVKEMRLKKYDVLLTTTILERGVTFENISIIVLGAEHRVFSKSSLVQIAGRADRKGGYTESEVYFIYHEMTPAIKDACTQITKMNQEGKELLSNELLLLQKNDH